VDVAAVEHVAQLVPLALPELARQAQLAGQVLRQLGLEADEFPPGALVDEGGAAGLVAAPEEGLLLFREDPENDGRGAGRRRQRQDDDPTAGHGGRLLTDPSFGEGDLENRGKGLGVRGTAESGFHQGKRAGAGRRRPPAGVTLPNPFPVAVYPPRP